jgi:hypothetical protein
VNIVISLDYEVFFGARTGSVERTLIEPSAALAAIARHHGVPLVFFVDVLFVLRLRELGRRQPALMVEHDRIVRQLETLARSGHELQLHLHPHWLDSHWDGQRWHLDLAHYRLHDLDDTTLAHTVHAGAVALREITGGGAVSAFRAGGWCLQPFERLRGPLLQAGIGIDSTVYAGGWQAGPGPSFDFRQAPRASRWNFDTDPLVPVPGGPFLEVPIASHALSPLFFWKLALLRKLGGARHRPLGDGEAIAPSRGTLWRKLLWPSVSVVSIDGLKASELESAWQRHRQQGSSDFVVIGHPKALTADSLRRFEAFLQRHREAHYTGLDGYRGLIAARPLSARAA